MNAELVQMICGREDLSEPFVRPDVAVFLNFLNNVPGPKMHELSAPDARGQMLAMGHVAELPLGDLAVHKDLSIPGPAGAIPARLYDARESREPGPVMVFFHGGGFVIGDLDTHGPYCAEAARQLDMPVVSVDYRLAPEHPFPAAPEDCEAAARWVAETIPCTGLVLSGDSAGGNLTVVTSLALRDNPAAVPVIAQNPIYPVVSDHNDWQSYRNFADGYLHPALSGHHREPRSTPRSGRRLCRGNQGSGRPRGPCRGGGQHPRPHQPAESNPQRAG
jgi:acetyl esterase